MGVEQKGSLLGIGQFAEATGLSIPTLRHYHELGLLPPAEVDGNTGYRRYRPEQVVAARCIRSLRMAHMPIRQIQRLIAFPDGGAAIDELERHLQRLREEARRSARLVAAFELALSRMAEGARLDEALEDVMEEKTEVAVTTGTRLIGISLKVADVERARSFYEQALRISFKPEAHPGGPVHYHASGEVWDRDEFLFTLWPGETTGPNDIWFAVDDVDAAWQRALNAGATAVTPSQDSDYEPRRATVKDPFGNCISIYKNWR